MGSERIMTTQQQFLDLLSDIEPSTTTVNDCSSAHNTLRDALKVHNEFSKVHVHTDPRQYRGQPAPLNF